MIEDNWPCSREHHRTPSALKVAKFFTVPKDAQFSKTYANTILGFKKIE